MIETKEEPVTVKEFVHQFADFNAPESREEIDRLCTLASSRGVQTTVGYIQSCFYALKRQAKKHPAVITAEKKTAKPKGKGKDDLATLIEEYLRFVEEVTGRSQVAQGAVRSLLENHRRITDENTQLTKRIQVLEKENEKYRKGLEQLLNQK